MGLWFFEGFGDFETQIVEMIAKHQKLPVEEVAKHYKEMLEKLRNAVKKQNNN